jgi:hypothetical protein
VRNDILCIVKEKWNILPKIRRKKANWISHSWRRNWLRIEGRTEIMGKAEEDISSYWMILRKREDARNRQGKH